MPLTITNSSLGNVDAGIPVGFGANGEVIRSPIINTTTAGTTISAYSGQTVVFAGLISKSRQSVSRKIPFLGDIPILGAAFRFESESESRNELLVVLTPRIINTEEDLEIFKQVESSRMSWCLSDILNIHGDVGLNGGNGLWGPAKGPVIYPDMQPTAIIDNMEPVPMESIPTQSIIEGQGTNGGAVQTELTPSVGAMNLNRPGTASPPMRTAAYTMPPTATQAVTPAAATSVGVPNANTANANVALPPVRR